MPRVEGSKIFGYSTVRAPAPVLESMRTGIDGLRREVRCSRGREEFGQAALIDGSGDQSGMALCVYARMEVGCRIGMTHYVCCRCVVSPKEIGCFSTGPWALHAFHQSVFTGWVTADDSLESLIALNVI